MKREKEGSIKEEQADNYTLSFFELKDSFYKVRKKRLHTLRDNIKLGKESMYDFDISMDKLIEKLSALNT